MFKYLIKRVLWMIPMLVGISLISFFIMHLAPGDITSNEAAFNPKASEESRQKLREMYNLDKPIIVQYGLWLKRMVTLDFGQSFASHQKPVFWQTTDAEGNVTEGLIQQALPITLMINLLGLAITLSLAIPLGIIAARKYQGWQDRSITLFNFIGFSIPGFWLSLLLMYWLGVVNNWFPISGMHSLNYESLDTWDKIKDTFSHLFLPVVIPSITGLAGITLFVKNGMLDVLQQDYITTARAKGLGEHKVVYTHALRNALLPLITIIGLSIPGLIGGSVIAETIFAIPGMGKLFYDAVLMRDFPVVMGILTIGSALTLVGNLLADVAYAWADPRVRRGVAKT
ncbi:MAG: ABC transporter permease [Methylotenera sp.]|jgi:peptide/nickel transport system permease protein|uniref:ABC transporter permease n=1 Tax=Methylotenera mobilis TaxID=359408 RepID=A0A351RBQ2_9PROT|nr:MULTISPECIES: ABC transporter permease [Methylotenera]MDP3776723.1 ABC transporter permease [Methylotenera sp.]PPC95527.1 MAG: ABC transporter permease [Methylotenera sp.]HBA09473.1 ABC transporter permease [Methylotenera mobilis]